MTYFEQFGLSREDIKKIIDRYFKENADILIGIDDPEVNQLIEVLVDAFAEAIEENNKQFSKDIKEYIQKMSREKRWLI